MKINIAYTVKYADGKTSETTRQVIDAFGIPESATHKIIQDFEFDIPKPGQIAYICGYSGSGKSSMLRIIHDHLQNIREKKVTYIQNWNQIKIDQDTRLIDFFPKVTVNDRIRMLSKCGLGEAFKFVSKFPQLSDGERFRFILYHSIMTKSDYLIIDEFCATLDRLTAKAVCNNISKMAQSTNLAMIFASAHDDISEYLSPDIYIKNFEKQINTQNSDTNRSNTNEGTNRKRAIRNTLGIGEEKI